MPSVDWITGNKYFIVVDSFHKNNKIERVSQSTTMCNCREVSEDFKSSRHSSRETTITPTKIKIKN